jgi:subtilase family serine protease
MLKTRRTGLSSILLLSGLGLLAACSAGHDGETTGSTSSSIASRTTGFATPAWATSGALVGRMDPNATITVQVHMKMQNEAEAIARLADIGNPDSVNYGKFVSDAEFDARYMPAASDYAAVKAHLTSHGLAVTEEPVNLAYVAVKGTVAQVEAAFSTKIGQYDVKGTTKRAPMIAASLPSSISGAVKGVLGIAEPMVMRPQMKRPLAGRVTPQTDVTASTCTAYYGQIVDTTDPAYPGLGHKLYYAGCPYTPPQIRAMYGMDTVLDSGFDGKGQTVAILDAFESPTLLADAQQYAKNNDPHHLLKSSQFKAYTGPGTPPAQTCQEIQDEQGWYGEQSLDVEAVHAMAPGANIAFVGAVDDSDQGLLAAMTMITTKHIASVVSDSWAGTEEDGGDYAAFESAAIQAGLKGIAFYFASGDDGDYVQSYGMPAPTPSFPTSLPEVTGVGGTSLELSADGARDFETGWETGISFVVPAGFTSTWPPSGGGGGGGGGACSDDAGAGSDDGGAAAVFPLAPLAGGTAAADDAGAPANVWWPAAPGGWYFGAGGGTSQIYLQPTWQAGIVPSSLATFDPNLTTPGPAARVVPDVSMLADPFTGFNVGMTSGGTYGEGGIGGTSLATPLFTAAMALAQQYAGRTFGQANALLYKASKHGAFHDVVPTANLQAVALPTEGVVATFNYTGPENSLATAKGYDNVTGLGSVAGAQFLEALAGR